MKVEVQSRKLIAPSTPTPDHLRDFKLSPLDQIHRNYTSFILYYLPDQACENRLETCEARNKQKQKSLAETLTLFYPFAGRYNQERLMIECNDNGAEYIEAKVSKKQLIEVVNGEVETRLLNQLVPYTEIFESATSPLVTVQVNTFGCGGIAIGLCFSHKFADGLTMAWFVDRWARVSREGIDQVDAPKFLLPALFPDKDSPEEIMFPLSHKRGVVTKRVVFDGARIAGLKKELKTTKAKLVTAMIWKSLIRLNQAKHGCLRPSMITNPMNLRGKVKLPVEDFCGNIFNFYTAKYVPNDHGNKVELLDLVRLLDDAMRKNMRDCAELESEEDLFQNAINGLKFASEEYFKGEADVYVCSSWCRFPLYEADFGWGKPVWVSSISLPVELISLLDSRDGDGIEAWIRLGHNDMVLFLEDPDIVAFTVTTTI